MLHARSNRQSGSDARGALENCKLALIIVAFALSEFDSVVVHAQLGHSMSAIELLSNENSLALRLVRRQSVPHAFWLWLSGLDTPLDGIARWIESSVLKSVEEIIEPNLIDATAQERIQSEGADSWIAAILGFTNRRAAALKLNCGHPMMAVSLLPLYRSLATRKLSEALDQTRNRLSELLVLIGALQELGDDFAQLLGEPVKSPYTTLSSILKVDLVAAGRLVRQVAQSFDPSRGEFDLPAKPASAESTRLRADLAWSDPKLLWQISAELMAKKAELVLPRQWADVAMPWTSIGDHWNALTHRLTQANAGGTEYDSSDDRNADDEIVSEMIDDLLAMQADVVELSDGVNEVTGLACSSHGPSLGAPRTNASDTESEKESDEEYPETDMLEPSVPKIAIVEIDSKGDAMFVNIMRRQIATARNSDHSVCLVALYVESEDVADRERIGTKSLNGLLVWQDNLVNWLAEHPHVREPFAFVTAEGQLVFSMQDIERTVATNLVREGLVTVLTGKRLADQGALARVAIPARYYAGIGSVCPNSGFAAEQLIEATWRCLSAARNQGKATIKSIEVF